MVTQIRSTGCWCGIAIVIALLLLPLVALPIIYFFQQPTLYRFPFPADRPLTEEDAVDLSRRAIILHGRQSAGMHPVPWSEHPDEKGRAPLFAKRDGYPDDGQVLWWIADPRCAWEYSVRVHRDGEEVVCEVARPL